MVLLVIDIQKGITNEGLYNYDEFISNTVRIIETARQNGIEVIFIQHDDGPGTGFSIGDDAFEIADQVMPMQSEKRYIKVINSCFGNKEFTTYLESKKEDTIMVVGLQTNFCIDATIKSAFERGYKVIVPNGTNSTFDNDYMNKETTYKYYNEMMWPKRFAECISMDEAVDLLRKQYDQKEDREREEILDLMEASDKDYFSYQNFKLTFAVYDNHCDTPKLFNAER